MTALIKPKEFKITDQDGVERTFILSKFTAVEGREIVAKYPIAALPKLGDYKVSEETMLKLMNYVAVPMPTGEPLRLSIKTLVDNHTNDWETLAKIEMAMMEYNCSFFRDGRISDSLGRFVQQVLQSISQMSMGSSGQSSQETKPPSTNSEQSTA